MGGHTVMARRSGNSFELASILASWLLGAGYGALVVNGRAKRELTRAERGHLSCPYIPGETKHEEVNLEVPKPKYKLAKLPDFRSKHELAMEERQKRQQVKREMEELQRQQKIIDDYERLPPDDVYGYRRHAWVVVLPPCRGVEVAFYIEPSTGERKDLTDEDYLGVDSVYDHRNYYVNMQSLSKQLLKKHISTSIQESNSSKISQTQTGDEQNGENQLRKDSKRVSISTEKVENRISQEIQVEDNQSIEAGVGLRGSTESRISMATREGQKVEGSSESRVSMGTPEGQKFVGSSESKVSMTTPGDPKFVGSSESRVSMVKREGEKSVENLELGKEVVSGENVKEDEEEIQPAPPIEYDLWNIEHWEHLLPGEPFRCPAQVELVEQSDKEKTREDLVAEAAAEKHLDMPNSWVEMLDLDIEEFQRRYPGGYKVVQYKKAKLELFAPYQRTDGLVKRVSTYHDYQYQTPHMQYDWFLYRADRMTTSTTNFDDGEITETYERGREDFLKKHTYALDGEANSLEVRRDIDFFSEARPDRLASSKTDAISFQEQFVDREDRLHTRRVTYTKRDPEKDKGDVKRNILCIVEQYNRNPEIAANDDIATKIFDLEHDYIEMIFHYAYNFVTVSSRKYTKPNLAETGGRMIIGPENISGYIASPNSPAPRALSLYDDAAAALAAELAAGVAARSRERGLAAILELRGREMQQLNLTVQLFHTNKNKRAQQLLEEQDTATRLVTHREREAVADPLAPYIARLGLLDPPAAPMAAQLREQCLNHHRDTQTKRETLIQKKIQQLNEEFKQKRLAWFKANQKKLQPEPETVFIEENSHLKYSLHMLEVRLSRHQNLSPIRLQLLEAVLDQHPMLENYQRNNQNADKF